MPSGIDLVLADHQRVNALFAQFAETGVGAVVCQIIDDLRALEGQPLIDAVAKLQEDLSAHVEDEELNLLPQLAAAATPAQLDEIGTRILQVKQRL